MPEIWQQAGFGLYVHWPFCQAKCPYCDFNSHVVAQIDQDRWAAAYEAEIARIGALTPGRVLRSVFFGGGTPSLMAPETVARVMDAVRATWTLANDVEVTLEANPTSVEAGRFAGYRDAGVNRVSLGVQALNDADLKRLGRLHSAAEARSAFDIARGVFERVSFDLIYARQDQTAQQWQDELTEALSMAVDHLSLYQLTIEDGTAFGDRFAAGGLRGLPSEDLSVELWDITQDVTSAKGFDAYETSNHARPGAQSTHNRIYWEMGDYTGIGPGAHGRLTLNGKRIATQTHLMPMAWLGAVEAEGSGERPVEVLTPEAQFQETLLMGLRLTDGVTLDRIEGSISSISNNIRDLEDLSLLEISDSHLRVTEAGRPLLNAVLRQLLDI